LSLIYLLESASIRNLGGQLMNRSCKVSLFLLAFLGPTLSSTVLAQGVDPQPFMPPSDESIKSIALLKIPEPQFGYFLGEGGSGPGATLAGLRGLLQGWTRPKHPEYAGFQFTAVAERLLTEHLKAAGFNVITVPVERKKRYQVLRNYKALSVPNVDAYLDVAPLGVGYRQSLNPYSTAEEVGPYLCVVVRLVSARSKNILYADTIQYGWRKAKIEIDGTDIDAPEQHVFENTEAAGAALTEGAQGRGIAWLSQGMDVAMRTIVSAFSSYPATGPSLQAGSTTSPMEVAKAAPASVSALRSGWRQKAVTDYQPLIGKWKGFSVGTRGKKYDFETTYRDDGTYTFRSDRGPLKSGRRDMRIADGVYVGKSYKTGESYTIAVYEDAQGNHVMKMHRTDGVTWTVAKTKSALSSFLAAGGDKVRVAPMAP